MSMRSIVMNRRVIVKCVVALCVMGMRASVTHAATLVDDTTVMLSENGGGFNVSVFPGKAAYDGFGNAGPIGDGTVVDYRFFNVTGAGFNSVGYASGGGGLVSEATAGYVDGSNNESWADAWTTSDPGTGFSGGDAADFTSATMARAQGVSGSVDISDFASGTIYFIYGSFDNPNTVSLTMRGTAQPDVNASHTEDPPRVNRGWISSFTFSEADAYDTISYTYTNTDTDGSRARFMGVIIDATVSDAAPEIDSLSPTNNATCVYPGADLMATFDGDVALVTNGTITIKNLDAPSQVVITLPDAQVTVSGDVLTINPTDYLGFGANYAIQISTNAVENLPATPNAFGGITNDTTWRFTTVAENTSAPVITNTVPADDATGVLPDANLVAEFDQIILVGSGNITISNLTEATTHETVAITNAAQVSISGNVLTIVPSVLLNGSNEFAVLIDDGAVMNYSDVNFAGINNTTNWSFRGDITGPTVATLIPADEESNGLPTTELVITFDEDVMAGSGTITVYRASDNVIVDTIAASTASIIGPKVTLALSGALAYSTDYYVNAPSGALRDLAGNDWAGIGDSTTWNFSKIAEQTTFILTATTDLKTGPAIPTDGVDFLPSGTGPYTYSIDTTPGDVGLQTRADFDMGAFNLNNTGDSAKDVTINALSLTNGTGGTFDFTGYKSRPNLTINLTGALAARLVNTHCTIYRGAGGAVALTAPNGITLVGGIDTRASSDGDNNRGGAVNLNSTGSSGSIQIDGTIITGAPRGACGPVTLIAANGINLSGGINTAAIDAGKVINGGAITITSTSGSVSIGTISANAVVTGTDGNLSITASSGSITLLSTLDLSLVNTVTMNAPNVYLNAGISGVSGVDAIGGGVSDVVTIGGDVLCTGGGSTVGKVSVNGDVALNGIAITVDVTGSELELGTYTLIDCTGTLSNSGGTPEVTITGLGAAADASINITNQSVELLIADPPSGTVIIIR